MHEAALSLLTMAPTSDLVEALKGILLPHYESVQTSDDFEESLDEIVETIKKEVGELALNAGLDGLSLQKASSKISTLHADLAEALNFFLDCAFATESTPGSTDAIDSVLHLSASVAAKLSQRVAEIVLLRAIDLTTVLFERVRGMACSFIGVMVGCLMRQPAKNSTLLDQASQALLPRFIDKSQLVRLAAVQAGAQFFGNDATDPDILQALIYTVQHDPSVVNRVAALESLQVNLETLDVVLSRVRDVKAKVRVTALKILEEKNVFQILDAEHCAALVEAGLTDRCAVTKAATTSMLRTGWMKASGYDPLKLLSKMNVMEFDAQCEMMLKTIVSATPEDLNALSAPEIEAYRDGVKRSIVAISGEKQDISVESLFFARVFCHQMKQGSKSTILGNIGQVGATILPDIMVVCDILERTVDKLMGAIEAQDDEMQDNLASMCQQLLQLTSVVELEEGSRRHLIIVMKRMLSSILTPDDLVEDAVKVLSTLTDRDDVVEHILEVLNEIERLSGVVGDELEENHVLRTLAIISVFLEIAPSRLTSCPQMSEIPKFVLPLVTHEKQLVREAAVSSLGKLGLFTVQDMVAETFKPLLLQITANEDESIETRAQALIALADWSMLNGEMISPCVVDQENLSVHGCVEAWFESSEPFLVCVAAEVASKLLYAGKLCDHEWLAQLVSVYFDEQFTSSAADEEEEDVKEIGSLVRLQQMLSVFFPVFCIKSKVGRDQFLQSIEPMLKIVCLKPTKNQKSRGSKAFPVDKMIAFVCDSVRRGDDVAEKAEEEARTQGGESNNTVVDAAPEASIELHVAIQLARFLANNHSAVTITSQRNLFKILAKIDLTPGIHDEPRSDLLTLKELTERLSMAIDDSSCVAALELMEDVLELAKVQSEDEESVSPDSDDETTDSHDDTPEATGSTLSKSFDRITLDGGSAHVDKENLTRDSFSCRDSLSMKEKSPEPSVSTKRRTGLRQGST